MLKITDFKKLYPGNNTPVLEIQRCELDRGIYWIKGENGSGKTSLLKSIAGLIPFEGKIKIDDLDINSNRIGFTKKVNYAEAEPKYPPFLTGKELIDFYQSTKEGYFPDLLSAGMGVEKFMHHKIATYSSGMLKKLSIVLGFMGDPSLVLLDEPLVALDVAAVDVLQNAINQYRKAGVSFLITSHQPLNDELIGRVLNLLIKDNVMQIEIA
ncbi:MAG: ABC transporter ATP-binding protein [Ferruginibacter sp.]